MNEQKIKTSEETSSITDRRKLNPKKPKAAGNLSFRKHNSLRFTRTSQRKQFGLKNKL